MSQNKRRRSSHPSELTEQQRRFCEYLIFNEGRTTNQEQQAGWIQPKHARQEASEYYGEMPQRFKAI